MTVGGAAFPPTIHDFGGFEPELYRVIYRAPGDPDLAARIASLLRDGGLDARVDRARGFDHGAWVPLMLLYPDGKIPVVMLSICPDEDAAFHYRMGRTLSGLRDDGVLVVGSGSVTHNLSAFFEGGFERDAEAPDWVRDFADWLAGSAEAGAVDDLLDYRARAPFAERNHPTDEHLLPMFVALGAADGQPGMRVHRSNTYAVLAMDAYRFG